MLFQIYTLHNEGVFFPCMEGSWLCQVDEKAGKEEG